MAARFESGPPARTGFRPRLLASTEPEVLPAVLPSGNERNWALEYGRIAARHWRAIACCAILCGSVGFVLLLFQRPVYPATATIEFLGFNDAFMDAQSVDPQSSGDSHAVTSVNLQTQIRLLQSKALIDKARDIVEREDLSLETEARDSLAGLRSLLGFHPESVPDRKRRAIEEAVQTLGPEILAGTRIIDVHCEASDPRVASALVNSLASVYVGWSSLSRLKSSQEASRGLGALLEDARIKLIKAERDLQERQLSSGIPADKSSSLADTKVRQLQTDLSQAQNDVAAKESRYLSSLKTPIESIPEVRDDPGVRNYQSQLAGVERDLANLSTTLGPQHLKIKQLTAQIGVIEQALRADERSIQERIKTDYEAARVKERLLSEEYEKQTGLVSAQQRRELGYSMAKREVDTARQEYETLLQRAQQAQVVSAIPVTTAQIVDQSSPAERPIKPRPMMFLGMGISTGLFLGWVLAFVLEHSDPRVRVPKQLPALLRVRTLGVVPSAPARLEMSNSPNSEAVTRSRVKLELATLHAGRSAIAESFRAALASVMVEDDAGYRPKVILITSAVPREGKTVVCCNLALAMAEAGRKVLLIDVDMRRPRIDEIFGSKAEPTLASVIGRADLEGSVDRLTQPTEAENLRVLPCGLANGQATGVLYSDGLKRLIEWARGEFHAVFIDAPPLSPFSDARVIGRLADGAILVLRSNHSHREEAQAATHQLQADGIPVLGAILNDCRTEGQRLQSEYHKWDNG